MIIYTIRKKFRDTLGGNWVKKILIRTMLDCTEQNHFICRNQYC